MTTVLRCRRWLSNTNLWRTQTAALSATVKTKNGWNIQASQLSLQTENPIRKIFDNLSQYKIAADKEFLSLALGDPSKYVEPPKSIKDAVLNAYTAPNLINSYANSSGLVAARAAIAKQYDSPITMDDVFLTGGCQQALDLCFTTLLSEARHNILIPSPAWPEYEANLKRHGFSCKHYKLIAEQQWKIDVSDMEQLIDENTKAILTNNPSNPCGSILSRENMLDVLRIADRYKLPIISDEIYSKIIFPNDSGKTFISYSDIKKEEGISVPILITSGLAKNYLVPGWKVGWIVLDDSDGTLSMIRNGITNLLTINFGPSSLCQSMIEYILQSTSSEYWEELNCTFSTQSKLFCDLINERIPELTAIAGHAAFYMMIKIHVEKLKDIKDDREFFEKLMAEQAVFVIPGNIFKMDNHFRAVICPPKHVLVEVVDRLQEFCAAHKK